MLAGRKQTQASLAGLTLLMFLALDANAEEPNSELVVETIDWTAAAEGVEGEPNEVVLEAVELPEPRSDLVVKESLSAPVPDAADESNEPLDEDSVSQASYEAASDCMDEPCVDAGNADQPCVRFGDWLGYDITKSSTTWLAGGDFGMTSFESFPTLDVGNDAGLTFGTGFHLVGGPTDPSDMPPRLFDLQMAFHALKPLDDDTTLDIRFGVGAFTDFESSVRKGIRFPGHVVSHTQWNERFGTVLGVDVYDRDDITLLPVAGLIWRPCNDLIFDIVFPQPKIQLRLRDTSIMYLSGELGGDTWAIERVGGISDNATYHDLRVVWGVSSVDDDSESILEVGWAFDRQLEYRSNVGNRSLDGAFLLRWQSRY